MTIKTSVMRVQDIILCLIRKWWRPLTHTGIIVAVWVNLVIIPWWKWEGIELEKAALFITAIGAVLGLRSLEKIKGVAE